MALSKSDYFSGGLTLIATAIGFFVGGPKTAIICGIAGICLIMIAHFMGARHSGVSDAEASNPQSVSATASPVREMLSEKVSEIREAQKEASAITGELYQITTIPRTMSWEILRDAFKVHGKEATVDCDVLVGLYVVNASSSDRFIREVRLSAEVDHNRINFEMQRDLRAQDMDHKKYEYAIESEDFYGQEKPLKQFLTSEQLLRLTPQEPAEGWVRFLAKDINPDKLDRNTWQVRVVTSVGREYTITKVSDSAKLQKIGLRRVSGSG